MTPEEAYYEACRHPLTGQSNPFFNGVHLSGGRRTMNSTMLSRREQDLEKIAVWEHLHKRSVARPLDPPPDWEVFQKQKTVAKQFFYEFPLYTTYMKVPLPNIAWAWL
eukprot:2294730-Prorocentrum_lima.AAC.1